MAKDIQRKILVEIINSIIVVSDNNNNKFRAHTSKIQKDFTLLTLPIYFQGNSEYACCKFWFSQPFH